MNAERLLERFLRYVRIDTTADTRSATYPSSAGQLELGRILVEELREMGLADAAQDEHGIVMATIESRVPTRGPVVALNAHLDTSPETTGANVKPVVWRNYSGEDLTLPGDPQQVIRVAQNPELAKLVGSTIVTTDGTTLLGSDDKSGVAVIMETVAHIIENREARVPRVRVCFTCDEEIGKGTDHVDLAQLGADVCYTLDGEGQGHIDNETFSADLATVVFRGVNIHPSMAKGRMVNAVRAAADFIARLPRDRLAPEVTAGRDGFIHPYDIRGGVERVELFAILRDFETAKLADEAEVLRAAAKETMVAVPGSDVKVDIRPQYRNMREGLSREPRAVAFAEQAFRRAGIEPVLSAIRGGTDGSLFTAKGLPTPNLSTGEHNFHSPLEWTCLEEMQTAVRVLVELLDLWSQAE